MSKSGINVTNFLQSNEMPYAQVPDFENLFDVDTFAELQNIVELGWRNRVLQKKKTLFTNFRVELHTRIVLFCSLIRSRLSCCCAAWTLTQRQLERQMVRGGTSRKSTKKNI